MSVLSAAARCALAACVATVAFLVAHPAAQNPARPPQPPANQTPADPEQPQPPIFRARVNVVRVDVSVTGRDDKPVEDLTVEDFEIEEDGVPQKVETAQFVRLSGAIPSDHKESIEIRSPQHAAVEAAREDVRLFAIFLDDYHVDKKPDITLPLRKSLAEFAKQFGPRDLIAIMDPLTPLSHLRFTRSREDLLDRMRTFEGRRGEVFPVKSAAEEAQLKERNVWELRGGVTLSALHALVAHLGGLREGRKSVLFVSQGPPVPMPGSRSMSSNDMRLDDVVEAANRGNVTINVLDPRPLGVGPLSGNYVLRRLSDETGGRAILNTNDPSEGLEKIIEDASAYYLVGYTPPRESTDGKFHKISVRVKRRGSRVLAREGYWAPTEKELNPELKPPPPPGVMAALTDLVQPVDGRPLEIWVGASRGAGTLTRLSVTWDPATASRYANKTATVVEVAPLDLAGKPSGPAQTIVSGVSKEAASVATFEAEPGTASLQFTAKAADGIVIDQWPERVRVPAMHKGLAIATPRFLRARSAFEQRALDTDPNPAPAASRRLRKTDRVQVEIQVYGAAETGLEVTAELLNKDGNSLVTLPIPAMQLGKARVTIPVSSLAPATYLLRVQARDGRAETQQIAPFQIVP
jgi:VWFA-related protein